jgi:hypothetical protein
MVVLAEDKSALVANFVAIDVNPILRSAPLNALGGGSYIGTGVYETVGDRADHTSAYTGKGSGCATMPYGLGWGMLWGTPLHRLAQLTLPCMQTQQEHFRIKQDEREPVTHLTLGREICCWVCAVWIKVRAVESPPDVEVGVGGSLSKLHGTECSQNEAKEAIKAIST